MSALQEREAFIALVTRLESISKKDPSAYRFRLAMLAALGYAVIAFVLLILLGLIIGIISFVIATKYVNFLEIKIFIILLLPTIIIARSLWVKVPKPVGIPLLRTDVPQLFQLIDTLSEALRAPRINHLLLVSDFNASIAQIPRLGLFAWYTNYLIIGYPLLHALSPDQFRAVLAHELGHLSRQHGSFSIWIGRLRATWGRLVDDLNTKQSGTILNWFLKWYAPYFMGYSFVLARADEYEADSYVGRLVSKRTLAEALIAIHVRGHFLDKEFWKKVTISVRDAPAPPEDIFSRIAVFACQSLPTESAYKWLSMAVAQQTDYDDSHPALRERLKALGYADILDNPQALQGFLPIDLPQTAAQLLLGKALPRYTAMLDKEWASNIAAGWKEMHEESQLKLARLQELNSESDRGAQLSQEESWEQARLTIELDGFANAKPLLQALREQWPDFTSAIYAIGLSLIEEEDESGIGYIQQAMDADADFLLPGCEALYSYFKQRGRDAEAEPYLNSGIQRAEIVMHGNQEARTVTPADTFHPNQLPAATVDKLVAVSTKDPEVKKAYLVRKVIINQPERICHVLVIVPKYKGFVIDYAKAYTNLLNRIVAQLDGEDEIIALLTSAPNFKFMEKKVRSIDKSLIYERG